MDPRSLTRKNHITELVTISYELALNVVKYPKLSKNPTQLRVVWYFTFSVSTISVYLGTLVKLIWATLTFHSPAFSATLSNMVAKRGTTTSSHADLLVFTIAGGFIGEGESNSSRWMYARQILGENYTPFYHESNFEKESKSEYVFSSRDTIDIHAHNNDLMVIMV